MCFSKLCHTDIYIRVHKTLWDVRSPVYLIHPWNSSRVTFVHLDVVIIDIAAHIPQDHIKNEEDGDEKQGDEDSFSNRGDHWLHGKERLQLRQGDAAHFLQIHLTTSDYAYNVSLQIYVFVYIFICILIYI